VGKDAFLGNFDIRKGDTQKVTEKFGTPGRGKREPCLKRSRSLTEARWEVYTQGRVQG